MHTRRTFLASAGLGVAGLAGCIGGNDGGSTAEDPVESMPAPVAGNPDAGVTVMVFEDYSCPHCREFVLDVYPKVASNYVDPGKVRYEHHDFPIPVDSNWSWAAGSAARSVQDQTDDEAFYEYSHALFENQNQYSYDRIASLAEGAGADPDRTREEAKRSATGRCWRPTGRRASSSAWRGRRRCRERRRPPELRLRDGPAGNRAGAEVVVQ